MCDSPVPQFKVPTETVVTYGNEILFFTFWKFNLSLLFDENKKRLEIILYLVSYITKIYDCQHYETKLLLFVNAIKIEVNITTQLHFILLRTKMELKACTNILSNFTVQVDLNGLV